MNKIQLEHHNEENSISDFSKDHLAITLKHMGKFSEWLAINYRPIAICGEFQYWLKYFSQDTTQYTTEQLIQEYIIIQEYIKTL